MRAVLSRRELLIAAGMSTWPRLRASAATYDLLIKGGRLIDPARGISRVADVAIRGGRVAAVRENLVAADASRVVDAAGKLVVPGLIDIHVHVAAADLSPTMLLNDGVTTMVDGGSTGADNVESLVHIAEAAPNRVRIFLNVARTGVTTPGELRDMAAADVGAARQAIERYRQWIVGVKVRLSESVCGDQDLEAVKRARQAAGPLPVMLHVGQTHSPLPAILALLQPGDIVTHIYSPPPHAALDESGHVLAEVRSARRRGIRFDVGNGRNGHITWPIVEAATKDGFWPDTISSDITGPGRTVRVFDLPTVMSKFLMLGMTVDQAVASVTSRAAASISSFQGLGTLAVGSAADVAILELRDGVFEFVDNVDGKRTGHQKLVTTATVVGGRVWDRTI